MRVKSWIWETVSSLRLCHEVATFELEEYVFFSMAALQSCDFRVLLAWGLEKRLPYLDKAAGAQVSLTQGSSEKK